MTIRTDFVLDRSRRLSLNRQKSQRNSPQRFLMYQGNYFWITFLGYLQIYEHSINIL